MGLKEQFQLRTKKLALGIINLCSKISKSEANTIISRQLIRSSCSVGANYRAVCRAKSTADFINKLNIVEEEADESIFWLDLLKDLEKKFSAIICDYIKEMNEILSIVVAAKKNIKAKTWQLANNRKSQIANRKSQIANRKSQIANRKSQIFLISSGNVAPPFLNHGFHICRQG